MNKYLSSKIKVVSFISILMVVYLHCYNYKDSCLDITTTITEGLNYGTFIEYFICNGFTRVCVPLFFIISGYLFFLGCDFSLSKYIYKVKSRFVSLVIPYFIWNFFFAFGSYLALHKKEDIILKEKNKNNIIVLLSIWIGLLVIKTVMSGLGFDGIVPKAIYRIAELIGIYAVWYGMDYVLKNKTLKKKLLSLSSYTFFIFCFHEPFLNFIMNCSLTFITNSTLGCLITYFIITNAGILLAILLGKLLRTYAGSIYNVLCGGRGDNNHLKVINNKALNINN